MASYNVENLDPVNDADRIERIGRQIAENLQGARHHRRRGDAGPGRGGARAAPRGDPTFAALVEAIAGAGGPEYDYRQIDPVNNEDGGAPNANIRVGFLFRPDRVSSSRTARAARP